MKFFEGFLCGIVFVVVTALVSALIEWLIEKARLKRRMIRAGVELAERAIALHRENDSYGAIEHPDVNFDPMKEMEKEAEARIAELKTEIKGKDEVIALLRAENSHLGEEIQEQREIIENAQSEKAYLQRLKATQESEIKNLKEQSEKNERRMRRYVERLADYGDANCQLEKSRQAWMEAYSSEHRRGFVDGENFAIDRLIECGCPHAIRLAFIPDKQFVCPHLRCQDE